MDHPPILEGWLVKSPPEKKASGPFKLFKAKWRRRWFVLYEPLASQSLPGTRAALDYYNNGRHQKKLGTIDLDRCEEVLCKLDTAFYRHVFSLRTKHKGRDRTYYLASESEEEMMKWVDCLCLALGLKENDEPVPPSTAITEPIPAPAPIQPTTTLPRVQRSPVPPAEVQAEPNRQADSSPTSTPPTQVPATNHTQPEYPLIDTHKGDGYIPLEECFTGKERSTVSPSMSLLMNKEADHRASLDSIPPEPPPAPPMKQGSSKLKEFVPTSGASLYDDPKKSYVNLDDNENVYKVPPRSNMHDEGIYKVPKGYNSDEEGIYKMPRPGGPGGSSDEEGVYKNPREIGHRPAPDSDDGIYNVPRQTPSEIYQVPPSHPQPVWQGDLSEGEGWYDIPPAQAPPPPVDGSARGSNSSGENQYFQGVSSHSQRASLDGAELYDVPKQFSHTDYRTSSTLGRRSTAAEIYDNPKTYRKVQSENNLLESVVPAPAKPGANTQLPFKDGRYENLPDGGNSYGDDPSAHRGTQRKSSHPRPPSAIHTSYQTDDLYDVPPKHSVNDSDKLISSPPPPKPCPPAKHAYINAPPPYGTESRPEDQHSKSYRGLGTPVLSPSNTASESFYMPMSASLEIRDAQRRESTAVRDPVTVYGGGDVYTDMKSMSLQKQDVYAIPPSSRPVNPSVHDVVPPPSKTQAFIEAHSEQDTYSIYPTHTHRTRSFKRPLISGGEVALPTRKIQSDASSSDDESSSSGSHDRSGDSLGYKPVPQPHGIMANPALSKMSSLNCTPPPPRNPGEVQYLDLALEEHSDIEKSPLSTRAPATGSASPTDYREIDFVKTKALNEMQKDVESKRKSSERSMDD